MKRIILVLFAVAALISCSKQNKIKIIETNFSNEIEVNTSLNFTFSEEMIPDSLIGLWTDTKFVQIAPETEGRFKWTSNEKLVFVPNTGFAPSTSYTVKVTSKVLEYSEGRTLTGDTEFAFQTPMIELIDARAYWEGSEKDGKPVLKVNMLFNQTVEPQAVASLLNLKIDKQDKTPTLVTTAAAEEIVFMVEGVEAEDKDLKTKITLAKGLTSLGGSMRTTNDVTEDMNIPSPFKLNVVNVQTGHDGIAGTISVYTTQAVNEEDLKKFVILSPAVKYEYEVLPDHFIIKSEKFNVKSQYQITIKEGLEGKVGGKLKHDYSQPLSFGEVEPTLRFTDQKEFYVSGKGSRNIEISIINIPKVEVQIIKIYENNILNYLRSSGSYYDDYYYDDYYYGGVDVNDIGDKIYSEVINTDNLPNRGINKVLTLDFEDKLPKYPGVYLIEVNDPNDYWRRAKKLIAISDIGLMVKQGKNHVTVFANSIKTTQPLPDVDISFIGNNNQVTFTGKTDASGVLIYNHEDFETHGFKTKLVTAHHNSEYNIIPLNRTRVNTSRFDVGGLHQNPSGLQAFIYGDRNLYRPGETMNISAIIRDYKWKSPGSIPVKVKISTPNGKTLKRLKKSLNEYGSFETNIKLSASAATGFYVVDLYTTNDVLIGSSSLKVEEFMPDRIRVSLSVDKEEYKPGEPIDAGIEAVNMFGPPAANRNYEVQMSTSRISFFSKDHPEYNYYIEGADNYFSTFYRDGETDSEGKATNEFIIPEEWEDMGVLRSSIFATVFDETGRPVNRLKSRNIYTQEVFFGAKVNNYYSKTGQPARFDLIAVDKDGKTLSGTKANIELIRHEYKTVMSRSGNYFRYRSEKVENTLETKTITLNEDATHYSFIPELSGRYEIRISKPGTRTYVSQYLYAYGWGATSYSSFKVDKEGHINIQLDKEKYNIGDKAQVLLKTPFKGKVLVTVETNKVVDYFYVETDKRAASFEIDIKEDYIPNVYITATLFKPHEESDLPLTVAHGFAPLMVEDQANSMPVEITAVERSRSNTKQKIKVKASPNSAITIAAVDEGILQVGGYSTPNPYGFFYQKRALEVESFNIYPYLFPELGAIRSSTGGGAGAAEMAKRLNPLQNNRVKLVTFWSGILTANNKGEVEYEIDLPQFSGNIKIMAVAYNGDKVFGSSSKNMKVADPIVQSVALPRFLSPGDKVKVPVILTNTTDKTAKCNTRIEVAGPITLEGEKSSSITIEPNSEKEVVFEMKVDMAMGQSSVTVTTNALGEEFVNATEIPVRPAAPLQKRNGTGVLAANTNQPIDINIDAFIESSANYKLVISNNPLVQFTNSLDYLVRYPYGCVEQTVSSAFPQIYFSDLLGTIYTNRAATNDASNNVQAAIDRIKLMQLYNGGLTYWPGSGSETWWGSVYAAHFALEARKAGYDVDEDFLKHLLKYLKSRLKEKRLITYYYNYTKRKEIAPKEVAYSLYVLSLAGEKPNALLNYYKANSHLLSLDSKYLLAGAFALTGDTKKYKEVVPAAFEGEEAVRTFSGSFNSHLRDEAIALNVLMEVDPDNAQTGIMAKHLSKAMKDSRYLNTQERSFGFLAMGKIARRARESNISAQVLGNNKIIGEMNNNTITLNTTQLKSKKLSIETKGSGNLYYFWESEGISKDGSFIEEDSYLAVRKTIYNKFGNKVSDYNFKQNDLLLIELKIRAEQDKYIENVAISDILPAGFEIENPRLTTLPPGMSYPNNRSRPDYMDIRDDRINLFVNVRGTTRYYYYLVRCVSPGTFNMGPVGADAMYDGEYHSYNGGGQVVIKK
jgi:uncharacterized protein YfaS (alpha-2-macroglobulin family)